MSFSTLGKDLLAVFLLCFCPASWWRDINIQTQLLPSVLCYEHGRPMRTRGAVPTLTESTNDPFECETNLILTVCQEFGVGVKGVCLITSLGMICGENWTQVTRHTGSVG
jgi:hypothetical protein